MAEVNISDSNKIILNELLCYAKCKFNKSAEINLVKVLSDFYRPDYITESVKLLCNLMEKLDNPEYAQVRPKERRKSETRTVKELSDILSILNFIDENLLWRSLPVFAAGDLTNVPTAKLEDAEFSTLFRKIDKLETKIDELANNSGVAVNYQQSNTVQGGACGGLAGELGNGGLNGEGGESRGGGVLSRVDGGMSIGGGGKSRDCGSKSKVDGAMSNAGGGKSRDGGGQSMGGGGMSREDGGLSRWASAISAVPLKRGATWADRSAGFIDDSSSSWSSTSDDQGEDFSTVINRKKLKKLFKLQKNNFKDIKQPSFKPKVVKGTNTNCTLKVARDVKDKPIVKKRVFFVSNVSNDTTCEELENWVRSLNINVINVFKARSKFKDNGAFRVCIDAKDADIFTDDKSWGSGVLVRDWVFKGKGSGEAQTAERENEVQPKSNAQLESNADPADVTSLTVNRPGSQSVATD